MPVWLHPRRRQATAAMAFEIVIARIVLLEIVLATPAQAVIGAMPMIAADRGLLDRKRGQALVRVRAMIARARRVALIVATTGVNAAAAVAGRPKNTRRGPTRGAVLIRIRRLPRSARCSPNAIAKTSLRRSNARPSPWA